MADKIPEYVHTFDDSPADKDTLARSESIKAMVKMIRNPKSGTPFTIGIFGKWGTGKTTFMKLLRNRLDDEDKKAGKEHSTYPIWFSPWKYDGKEEVWNALIQTIFVELKKGKPDQDSFWARAYDCANKISYWAVRAGLKKFTGADIKELDTMLFRDKSEPFKFMGDFEGEFEKIISEFFDDTKGKLVIFIDDLDRCRAENVIEVLETIKIFLSVEGTVFIIGVDNEVIERGIRLKYRELMSDEKKERRWVISGHDYMDKIIQLAYYLPAIEPKTFEEYIKKMVGEKYHSENKQAMNVIKLGANLNPRRGKRLLNGFNFLKELAKSAQADPAKLIKLQVIQIEWNLPARWFRETPELYFVYERWCLKGELEGKEGIEVPEEKSEVAKRTKTPMKPEELEEEETRAHLWDLMELHELRRFIEGTRDIKFESEDELIRCFDVLKPAIIEVELEEPAEEAEPAIAKFDKKLLQGVFDEDYDKREAAVSKIKTLKDKSLYRKYLNAIINQLTDSDGTVRRKAAWALGVITDMEAVGRLIEVLQKDINANARYAALQALEKIGTKEAMEIVAKTYIIPKDKLYGPESYEHKLKDGSLVKINEDGRHPGMVLIPGTNDEKGFWIDVYPVTNAQFEEVFKEHRRSPLSPEDDSPVTNVTWHRANEYAKKEGKRLPTEEEWERAARGPKDWEYSFGNEFDINKCRVELDWKEGSAKVNSVYDENVNGYGVYDMSGNIWEWTGSWYDNEKKFRVLRGGSWDDLRGGARCAYRSCNHPDDVWSSLGFRCAEDIP